MLVSVTSLLVLSGFFFYWQIIRIRTQTLNNLGITANLVGENCIVPLTFNDRKQCRQTLATLRNYTSIKYACILDKSGKLFASFVPDGSLNVFQPDNKGEYDIISWKNMSLMREIYYKDLLYGYIYIISDNNKLNTQIFRFGILLLSILALIVSLVMFFANKLQSVISQPIIYLADKTRIISESGDYSMRVEKVYEDEIGMLYDEFNAMFAEIGRHNNEMQRSNEQLHQQQERFLTILDHFNELIVISSIENSEVLFVNKKLIDLMGYDPTGKKCEEIFKGFNKNIKFCNYDNLSEENPEIWEYYNETFDKYYLVTDQLVTWPDGRKACFEVSINISQRRKAEQGLAELNEELEKRVQQRTQQLNDAVKELESFAYSVSHDLRTPLRGIDGFSQILIEDYYDQLDSFGKDYLSRIRRSSQKMGVLIDDILNLSRISRFELNCTRFNISHMVTEILYDFKTREQERKVKYKIQPDIWIKADKNLIGIVMQNLLSNAWKYTSRSSEPTIEFGSISEKNREVYYVRDNGIGFNMKYKNKLFLPFHRLHAEDDFPGTGIGLATVLRIIRRHNGRIWADSKPQKGAVFYFTLQIKDNTTSESI